MNKTFYKEFYKKEKLTLAFQRFNKGYKNLPTKFYKNGIHKIVNSEETTIYFVLGVYKLIIINKK